MRKISQQELLREGFWHEFSDKNPSIRKVASIAGSVADVVAPEIMNPLRKSGEWLSSTKEKAKRAGMTKDQIAMDFIMEDGYFPLENQKIRWNSKENADGTYTGTIKVGELENDPETGKPGLGRTFSPDKSTYILKFNPQDRTVKRVKGPERHLATSHEDIRNALEKAGHDVVGTLSQIVTRPDGTMMGRATIRVNGVDKPVRFTYNRNDGKIQVN